MMSVVIKKGRLHFEHNLKLLLQSSVISSLTFGILYRKYILITMLGQAN